MARVKTNDNFPEMFLTYRLSEIRKPSMLNIMRFLGERGCSKLTKSELLRRFNDAQSAERVSHAQRQAIGIWLQNGSTGSILSHYNPQNGRSPLLQTSRVTKRKATTELDHKPSKNAKIKREEVPKPQTQLKECSICTDELPAVDFPLQISAQCTHDSTCCHACIARSIAVQVDEKQWDQISCLECPVLLSFDDVKTRAWEPDFIKYDKKSLLSYIQNDPNFTNCLGSGCGSGQIHPDGDDQPIMTCQDCDFKTCFTHKVPWHVGLTCTEYDARQKQQNSEEAKSLKWIQKETRRCPKCQVPIQKNKGCDHMTCKKCKYQFCWECFADWLLIVQTDNSAHRPTCKYYPRNPVPRRHGEAFQPIAQGSFQPSVQSRPASRRYAAAVDRPIARAARAAIVPVPEQLRRPSNSISRYARGWINALV